MKKASLSAIYSALKGIDFDSEILAEVEKELNRGEDEKAKNAELYEVADALPAGFTKGKMQYAITRLWVDEVTKTEGKVNTYSRKG